MLGQRQIPATACALASSAPSVIITPLGVPVVPLVKMMAATSLTSSSHRRPSPATGRRRHSSTSPFSSITTSGRAISSMRRRSSGASAGFTGMNTAPHWFTAISETRNAGELGSATSTLERGRPLRASAGRPDPWPVPRARSRERRVLEGKGGRCRSTRPAADRTGHLRATSSTTEPIEAKFSGATSSSSMRSRSGLQRTRARPSRPSSCHRLERGVGGVVRQSSLSVSSASSSRTARSAAIHHLVHGRWVPGRAPAVSACRSTSPTRAICSRRSWCRTAGPPSRLTRPL